MGVGLVGHGLVVGQEETLRVLYLVDLVLQLLNVVRKGQVVFVPTIQFISLAFIELLQFVTDGFLPIQLALQQVKLVPQSRSDLVRVPELCHNR